MIPIEIKTDRETLQKYCSISTGTTIPPWGGITICKVLGKFLLVIDTEDESLSPNLIRDGYWESWITLAMARQITKGMNCIDVGANLGYYSVLMSAASETGRVLVCEPNHDYSQKINQTLKLNSLNAEICVQAISNTVEELVKFYVPGKLNGSTSFVWDDIFNNYDLTYFSAYTNTLDNICADWDSVDFVKIDVEGAEPYVWYGMRNVLKNNADIMVFMEFTPSKMKQPEQFLLDILKDGFSINHVETSGNIVPKDLSQILDEKEWIMLAIRRDPRRWKNYP